MALESLKEAAMTATALSEVLSALDSVERDEVGAAATRLYDAEVALHIARQSGVDAWVFAAYDRLHVAVVAHRAALAAANRGAQTPGSCRCIPEVLRAS